MFGCVFNLLINNKRLNKLCLCDIRVFIKQQSFTFEIIDICGCFEIIINIKNQEKCIHIYLVYEFVSYAFILKVDELSWSDQSEMKLRILRQKRVKTVRIM